MIASRSVAAMSNTRRRVTAARRRDRVSNSIQHFRTCGLYLRHVHRVPPDQQLLKLPELMRNDVWPGVWPWHGMAVTPGNTSPF